MDEPKPDELNAEAESSPEIIEQSIFENLPPEEILQYYLRDLKYTKIKIRKHCLTRELNRIRQGLPEK
jgi:hypothetical protein